MFRRDAQAADMVYAEQIQNETPAEDIVSEVLPAAEETETVEE